MWERNQIWIEFGYSLNTVENMVKKFSINPPCLSHPSHPSGLNMIYFLDYNPSTYFTKYFEKPQKNQQEEVTMSCTKKHKERRMSHLEEDMNKQLVLLAVSPTQSGANKISSCFAGYDKNQPSDVVSATPSVFPRCIWLHNCAVSFTSFRSLQRDLWFCNFPQPGAYEHLALGPPSQWEAQETVLRKAENGENDRGRGQEKRRGQ